MERNPHAAMGEFEPFYGRTGMLESRLLMPLPPPSLQWLACHSPPMSMVAPPQPENSKRARDEEDEAKDKRKRVDLSAFPCLKWHPSSLFVIPQLLLHHLIHEGGALPSSFGILLLLQHVADTLVRRWRTEDHSHQKEKGGEDTSSTCFGVSMVEREREVSALLRFLLYWHHRCRMADEMARENKKDRERATISPILPFPSSSSSSSLEAALAEAGALWRRKEYSLLWKGVDSDAVEAKGGDGKENEPPAPSPPLHLQWFISSLTLVGVRDGKREGDGGSEEVYPACSWRSVTLIGRDRGGVNDIIVAHPSCSGQHAALQVAFHRTGWEEEEETLTMELKDSARDAQSTPSTSSWRHRIGELTRKGSLTEFIEHALWELQTFSSKKADEAEVETPPYSSSFLTEDAKNPRHRHGAGSSSRRDPSSTVEKANPSICAAKKTKEEMEVSLLFEFHELVKEYYAATLDGVHEVGGIEAAFSVELEVVDLGSTNGTYVQAQHSEDGEGSLSSSSTSCMKRLAPFTPHVLREGDSVRFGLSTRSFVVVRSNS